MQFYLNFLLWVQYSLDWLVIIDEHCHEHAQLISLEFFLLEQEILILEASIMADNDITSPTITK